MNPSTGYGIKNIVYDQSEEKTEETKRNIKTMYVHAIIKFR